MTSLSILIRLEQVVKYLDTFLARALELRADGELMDEMSAAAALIVSWYLEGWSALVNRRSNELSGNSCYEWSLWDFLMDQGRNWGGGRGARAPSCISYFVSTLYTSTKAMYYPILHITNIPAPPSQNYPVAPLSYTLLQGLSQSHDKVFFSPPGYLRFQIFAVDGTSFQILKLPVGQLKKCFALNIMYRVFKNNCVFSQFTATPPTPTSL